jgi:hypothetical protein
MRKINNHVSRKFWNMGRSFCNFFSFKKWIHVTFKWKEKTTLHKWKPTPQGRKDHPKSKAAVQITLSLSPGLWNMNADLVSLPCTDIKWHLLKANYFSFYLNSSLNFITSYHSVNLQLLNVSIPIKYECLLYSQNNSEYITKLYA